MQTLVQTNPSDNIRPIQSRMTYQVPDNSSVKVIISRANFSLAVIEISGKDLKQIAYQLQAHQNNPSSQSQLQNLSSAIKHQQLQHQVQAGHLPLMPDESTGEDAQPLFFIPCVLDLDTSEIEPMFLAQLVELTRQYNFLPIGLKTEDLALAEPAAYAGLALFAKHCQADKTPADSNALLVEKIADENLSAKTAAKNSQNQQANDKQVNDKQANDKQGHNKALDNRELDGKESAEITSETSAEAKPYIHYKTVKAGEQVYAEGTDLIVLGDVESGAEVIADGSIHIGGALMGKAYAGNALEQANKDLLIKAYSFEPELVSIAGFYQLKEDIPKHYSGLSVALSWLEERFNYQLQ